MARSFSEFTVFKEFSHPEKTKVLQYIEMVYSKDSALHGIEKHSEKRAVALKKLGIQLEETVELKSLAWHYLSYYENNLKFQNLLMYKNLFYDMHRIATEEIGSDDTEQRMKAVKLRVEIVSACEDLEAKITRLMNIIYPASLESTVTLELANINKVRSHEERLKEKKKQATSSVTV